MTRIRAVAATGSTNADLLADTAAVEGDWLRADLQTAGRGRQGRDWTSPPGNLYASTLVALRPVDPPAATLALVAAVALEEAVSQLVPRGVAVKWPNDVLVAGAKLSGILLERAGERVVIGFGVNLAHHPDLPDRPATSLAAHGAHITPAAILDRLAPLFAAWLHHWRVDGMPAIAARWQARAHPPGTALVARLADGASVTGAFERLDPDGALVLRLADGATRAIHAADVFLV